jgi:hypothetical protein
MLNIYGEILLENSLGGAPAGRWDQKENLQFIDPTQLRTGELWLLSQLPTLCASGN